MLIKFTAGLVLLLAVVVAPRICAQINHVSADATNLTLEGRASQKTLLLSRNSRRINRATNSKAADRPQQVGPGNPFAIPLPRWDGPRDRLYSGFLASSPPMATRTPLATFVLVEKDGWRIHLR